MNKTSANTTGRLAEDHIALALDAAELEYIRQVPAGTSIWGSNLRADFFVTQLAEYPGGAFIESKYQSTSGTAYEKIPLVIRNITDGCYTAPVLLVLGGMHMPERVIEWARGLDYPGLRAFSVEEFQAWVIRAPKLLS